MQNRKTIEEFYGKGKYFKKRFKLKKKILKLECKWIENFLYKIDPS